MQGPQFLVLYAAVSLAVFAWVRFTIRERESAQSTGALRVRDPYEIAYLRGGLPQLVQVVVLSLIRRGLLEPRAGQLRAFDGGASNAISLPVERAVLDGCRGLTTAATLDRSAAVQAAAEPYRLALEANGLVPNDEMRAKRRRFATVATLGLLGFAAAKFLYALATGHRNVLLLVVSGVLVAILFSALAKDHRTRQGDETLRNLAALFSRVKRGPRPLEVARLHEALLLAAVFGDFSASGLESSAWRRLFPKRSDADNSGGGCGSAGGCGGGGGCGGCGS
jgi:uncharacterized protein (TIGR04222 family)